MSNLSLCSSTTTSADWIPKVTALVPCYNAAEFITRTLNSLCAQTWQNIEILVGDDHSTDTTLEVVRHFANSHKNVRIMEQNANLGWLRNSNKLMTQATGELMFFAFHDDLVAPTYVEKLVGALRYSPMAILSYSDLELIEIDDSRSIWIFDQLTGLNSSFARGLVLAKRSEEWWVPNRGIFRATAFRQIGGIKFNDSGEYSADWTWLLEMALLGQFVRVPEVLCYKYFKKDSLSKTWPHDSKQRASLRRAGRKMIRESGLPSLQKFILVAYISCFSPLPQAANQFIKQVLIASIRSIAGLHKR